MFEIIWKSNLEVSRCAERDWAWVMRAPCRVDSPERVLLAVLGPYDRWSISSLAEAWRTPWRLLCSAEDFEPGAPMQAALPDRPPRALKELVVRRGEAPWSACRGSTRHFRRDGSSGAVSASCSRMRMPPPAVRVVMRARGCESGCSVNLSLRATRYAMVSETGNLVDWREEYICVCDATVAEMDTVLAVQSAAGRLQDEAWEARRAQMQQPLPLAL